MHSLSEENKHRQKDCKTLIISLSTVEQGVELHMGMLSSHPRSIMFHAKLVRREYMQTYSLASLSFFSRAVR